MSLELSRVCSAISPSPTLAIDAKAKEMRLNGRDVVSFCAGEPDFVTPQYIRTAAHEALDMGITQYTPSAGTIELRRAICDKLKRDNGLSYKPTQIIVSNGAKASLFTAISAVVNPGDEVIIPTPCWVSYPEMVRIAGGVPVLVPGAPEKEFVTEACDLEPFVTERTKALILNTPNNPNGCIWNRRQLTEIAALAVERGFYVISDEIYEKLIYDGEEHVSIASLGEDIYNQTILINGVSKAYAMTGWRIGYTAAPLPIVKAMNSMQSQVASGSNSIAQYACVEALNSPKGPAEIERMRGAYDERRRHIVYRINSIPGLRCMMPKGAFYAMMDVSGVFGRYCGEVQINDSMTFAEQLLEQADVAVVPGSAFCTEGFCRMSYATSMENIDRGLNRLKGFVRSLEKRG
ncbi:MAG: pyridoxal phosphate-dependent aminotransferase [Clostridia bacterium]|nr:pyridoxal phosphate-dependent aminotransferase [Clostridia bacterium]